MRRPKVPSYATVIAVALVATTVTAQQDVVPLTSIDADLAPRIVNGVLTADYPTTGALLTPANPSSARLECSGTLIGCETFLTAAHCVESNPNPSRYVVFLQHAGFFGVSDITIRSDYDFPVGDVAVLKLSALVTGIRPMSLNTTRSPPVGTVGIIAGFGRAGGFADDYGLKRNGSVITASCTNGVSDTTSVCWSFMNPLGAPGSDSNTCNGDSGGPLFVDFGAGLRLAGVTSGGTKNNCLPTDNSYDANVYFYRSWIQAQGGADLSNTACGNVAQVGDLDATVLAASGELSATSTSATHSFPVPSGTSLLRVSMNAVDDGSDFDLYVKAGSPPTTSDFDCAENGPGQYGSCEFTAPAVGTWYALVNRASGSGMYQVTATSLGSGCADLTNTGKACDDGNVCTQNDKCLAGACVGTNVFDGISCDDGNICTQADSCQAGVCIGTPQPRTDCRGVVKSNSGLFRLQDKTPSTPDNSNRLTWNWAKGGATAKAEFGDPVANTSYDLCVYDQTAETDDLILAAHVAGGAMCNSSPCWKERTTGFKYRDRRQLNGPVRSLVLKAGNDGRAKITLQAKGESLILPTLPLEADGVVTVQISNGTTCWGASYGTSIKNDTFQFKARAD